MWQVVVESASEAHGPARHFHRADRHPPAGARLPAPGSVPPTGAVGTHCLPLVRGTGAAERCADNVRADEPHRQTDANQPHAWPVALGNVWSSSPGKRACLASQIGRLYSFSRASACWYGRWWAGNVPLRTTEQLCGDQVSVTMIRKKGRRHNLDLSGVAMHV
ncbi:uncharacterized protein [Zea mays]|uniref:uncharacterized protein n=1 Tax=Zea mays TaxID=4577 RepID=UPI0009AA0F6F|nr:uncharacterized protein LOC103634497 [Zea mays]|eukprot:XP_020396978.1 uncharacterized protein LOC103634497 [Zea mays]